ncbi:unnamed protein product [Toxocara canis]|uniref:Uncharacterized protein n=1 Tax=Toxocara canis TaxID=6265 RepID=A0A183UT25_TOXCA|nr:unnamed protein product [Toxocara canis]
MATVTAGWRQQPQVGDSNRRLSTATAGCRQQPQVVDSNRRLATATAGCRQQPQVGGTAIRINALCLRVACEWGPLSMSPSYARVEFPLIGTYGTNLDCDRRPLLRTIVHTHASASCSTLLFSSTPTCSCRHAFPDTKHLIMFAF